ncbi:hypothetical protein AQUCO_01100544v1, partial [Aquilegia coerulea]
MAVCTSREPKGSIEQGAHIKYSMRGGVAHLDCLPVSVSSKEEELEVAESLNTEGQFGNSGSIKFSESPSLAIKAPQEISQPSNDNEDKANTNLIKTEALENESQLQKDQTDDFVEETGDTSKDDKIDDYGNQTLSKIYSQNASEDNVEFLKSSAVTTEENNDENITEKIPIVPITLVSNDENLQEEKSGGGGGTVMHDAEQKNDALFSLDHHLVENSGSVSDDQMTTEICGSQIEEEKGVTSSEKDQTEGQKSDANQNFKSKQEENMISTMGLEANNKEEIIDEDLNADNISIREEAIMSSFHEGEIGSSNLEGMTNSSETISQTEDRDDEKREGDDNLQHMLNDKKELAPEMKHGGLDFKTNNLDDNLDRTPIEQVNEEPKIVEASEDAEKDITENDCSVKVLDNKSTGDLQGNESTKEDNEAKPEGEVKEEYEVSGARDEHSGKQNKEKNETIEELSTVSNKDENELHENLKDATEGEAKEKILEDDTVVDINKVSIGEEPIEDIFQEHEVGKEIAITREGKGTVEMIMEDASVTDLSTTLGREEFTKEIFGEEKMEAEEHEAEAKEFNFPVESTSEVLVSTENEEILNTRDEEEQQKNHHADPVIETTVEESVQKKSSEDLDNTSTGINFEATELTEKLDIISIKDVDSSSKIQDADCIDEITEEEKKENPGEDKMEPEEHEAEAKESNFPMGSTSEVPDSTEKEDTLNTRGEQEQQKNHHAEESIQKKSSEALNNNLTALNFEVAELTENTEIKSIKDAEDLNMIHDADCTDDIAEIEIIQKESTEKLDTDPSLVRQVYEEQRNEEVLKEEEGANYNLNDTSLEKETEKASLPETEQEDNKLIDLSKGLEMTERSFTDETIKTELTDHLEDDENQKEEVITSSDLPSLEENLSSVASNKETECLGVESQKKHVDGSTTTHDDPRKGVEEMTVVVPEEVHEGNTEVPKEEHNIENIPMIEEPETTISQSQQEKFEESETTVEVIEQGETNSMKNEKSGESDSTQVVDHSDAKEYSSCAKTEKDQHSSTIFGTEAEVNHERNIAEDNAVKDQSTIPLKDETIGQSCIDEDTNEQNEIKLEAKLEDENQIQRSSVEDSTITINQNEQVCDEPRITDVVEDREITREEDNILKDITSVRIGDETTDVSTEEDKKESWKADGEVCGDLEYTENELIQDAVVKENSINTIGDETVAENSNNDEEVSASLDVAGPKIEIDEQVINGNDSVTDHSTMYDGKAAAKQSFQEDENERPEKEVSGEIESAVTSNDNREKIVEDDIFTDPFAASTDDVDISSHEEEVHVRLEPTIQDEAVEEHTLQELSTEEPHTVSLEKLTTKVSSQEVEAREDLETDSAEEDRGNQTLEDGTGTDIPMVSDKDKTPEVSSQEDEKVANMPRAEVVESDLEPTEGVNYYPKETEIVSLGEKEDLKKSLINLVTTEAPLDELKTGSTGDDAANQTMDVHVVSEETTKSSSQEDRKEVKPPGGEAEESDLLSIQGGADFVKGTEGVSLEEEEDQRKSMVNFGTRVAPSEEITTMESNDKLTSEEQVIDESQEKTEHTSTTHESNSGTLLQEKLSLDEAETGEIIVADSNLPSEEIFSTPIEENSGISHNAVVEDVKHVESSNSAENTTQDTFPRENLDADEAKQEKSEIPVEASA